MINGIEIIINDGIINKINALILYKEKKCYINEKEYDVDDNILEELKNIILYWDKKYIGNSKVIDQEEFKVIVYSNTGKDIYYGKGKYPNNYNRFKEIIGDINGK